MSVHKGREIGNNPRTVTGRKMRIQCTKGTTNINDKERVQIKTVMDKIETGRTTGATIAETKIIEAMIGTATGADAFTIEGAEMAMDTVKVAGILLRLRMIGMVEADMASGINIAIEDTVPLQLTLHHIQIVEEEKTCPGSINRSTWHTKR